jgi:hypothetical protein
MVDMHRCTHGGVFGLAGLLLIVTPSYAETTTARPTEYKATVAEDPAAKVCQLALAFGDSSPSAAVNFQLLVAQMKRQGTLAGPLVTGFTVDSRKLNFAAPRAARQAKFTSVAFVSERYTSVALPKVLPFKDGSVGVSTLDFAEGQELIKAVLRAEFELLFTRKDSAAADSYKVSAPPPDNVISEFSVCVSSLASF